MSDPKSPEEWLRLAAQHELAAKTMCEDRKAAGMAYGHVGFGAECALKAYIMHKERFNQWPSKDSRPDLHTHNLRDLMDIAGIPRDPKGPLAPQWAVVLQWNRAQGYDPKPTPRKVARQMVEAAFGSDGVVTWIRQQF